MLLQEYRQFKVDKLLVERSIKENKPLMVSGIIQRAEAKNQNGRIYPKDIAYIQPKQAVRISLTAYDASRYGTIDGEVLKVSADAVEDKAMGMSYYLVDVSMDSTLYEDDGSAIEILPGMVASIDVLAGKRTVFDYIWQPMAKVKERAFTD